MKRPQLTLKQWIYYAVFLAIFGIVFYICISPDAPLKATREERMKARIFNESNGGSARMEYEIESQLVPSGAKYTYLGTSFSYKNGDTVRVVEKCSILYQDGHIVTTNVEANLDTNGAFIGWIK